MAILDEDAAQVAAMAQARGMSIESATPRQLRALLAAAPRPLGPNLHAVTEIAIPVAGGQIAARAYHPSAEARLPMLLWFHGGGMVLGNLDSADWVCRTLCAQSGHIVISVDYRLAPEHKFPTAVEDSYAALRHIQAYAASLGGDPARIAVAGDSAGGACAAVACLLAAHRGTPQPHAQLLIYPDVNRDPTLPSAIEFDGPLLTQSALLWFRRHYHSNEAEYLDWRATPPNAAVHKGLARACILTAEMDPIRDAGEAYGAQLAQAGVMVTMKRYNGVQHGFFTTGPAIAKSVQAVADAARFLREISMP